MMAQKNPNRMENFMINGLFDLKKVTPVKRKSKARVTGDCGEAGGFRLQLAELEAEVRKFQHEIMMLMFSFPGLTIPGRPLPASG